MNLQGCRLMYRLSIKRASLSSTARDLFGITAYPQSRPMRTFSGMTIEKLLAKPKLGPILKDIIEDGAKLIAESRWTTEELVNGQFTLRATEVMMAVEDAMVEADVWVSRRLYHSTSKVADLIAKRSCRRCQETSEGRPSSFSSGEEHL